MGAPLADAALLLIELEGPLPVWRRMLVSPFTKLGGLHHIIQVAMDWDGRLPHRFILRGDLFKRIEPGKPLDPKRERNWRLGSALYPDDWFSYEYGDLDPQIVQIHLIDYYDVPAAWRLPRCIGGDGELRRPSSHGFKPGSLNRRLSRLLRKR